MLCALRVGWPLAFPSLSVGGYGFWDVGESRGRAAVAPSVADVFEGGAPFQVVESVVVPDAVAMIDLRKTERVRQEGECHEPVYRCGGGVAVSAEGYRGVAVAVECWL